MDLYTIAHDTRAEQIIEKSRFICSLKKVQSEAEAQEFIKAVKKEFWDATHNCSTYLIDDLAQRSSDDGEPSGTAGLPMLEVLRKNKLTQVAAVVTRYFGGIKLGAGGLVRAYTSSVVLGIESAGLAKKVLMGRYAFSCGAEESGKIINLLYQQQIFQIADVAYDARVTFTLFMPQDKYEEACAWLTDALQKNMEPEKVGEEYVEVVEE